MSGVADDVVVRPQILLDRFVDESHVAVGTSSLTTTVRRVSAILHMFSIIFIIVLIVWEESVGHRLSVVSYHVGFLPPLKWGFPLVL